MKWGCSIDEMMTSSMTAFHSKIGSSQSVPSSGSVTKWQICNVCMYDRHSPAGGVAHGCIYEDSHASGVNSRRRRHLHPSARDTDHQEIFSPTYSILKSVIMLTNSSALVHAVLGCTSRPVSCWIKKSASISKVVGFLMTVIQSHLLSTCQRSSLAERCREMPRAPWEADRSLARLT